MTLCLKSISDYADICELGFPHNTPIADGGQIQGSSHRALKNGITLKDVFKIDCFIKCLLFSVCSIAD